MSIGTKTLTKTRTVTTSMKFLVTDIEFDFDDDYPEDITGNTEHICNNALMINTKLPTII